ncbi:hypothetical protein [Flavicella sp.]|uniref:hypothetical protein n=1 Tax=Flavicella sp. TaxID=2957742 RepID=UPI0030173909
MNKSELIKGIHINDCYDFVDVGDESKMTPGLSLYFELMDKVRSMHNRVADFGTKESILKHLISVEKLSRHLATKVYYDGLEYYHGSTYLSKQAQKNIYADKIDRMIAIAEMAVKGVKDAKAVASMIKDAFIVRGLDKEEKKEIPGEWFKKQFVLYSTDALEAGLIPANRVELKEQAEAYPEITEKQLEIILQDSLITDLNLFPDDEENPRKD